MKLFSKEIEPCCIYCARSRKVNENEVICIKHGIVSCNFKCRKYKYDPTKRIPPEPAVFDSTTFSADDFKIN